MLIYSVPVARCGKSRAPASTCGRQRIEMLKMLSSMSEHLLVVGAATKLDATLPGHAVPDAGRSPMQMCRTVNLLRSTTSLQATVLHRSHCRLRATQKRMVNTITWAVSNCVLSCRNIHARLRLLTADRNEDRLCLETSPNGGWILDTPHTSHVEILTQNSDATLHPRFVNHFKSVGFRVDWVEQ